MDPYSQYKKQTEYYDYFENQKKNYVDLSKDQTDPNNSIKRFAEILFIKSTKNLNQDLSGILIDETMETVDIFCMLIELVLYGLDILTESQYTIFDLVESYDDIVYTIRSYLKSAGFDVQINEILMDDDTILYRDNPNYYCEIVSKPLLCLCDKGWYVLNYQMIENMKFNFSRITSIETFKAFFISKQNKIFTVNFKYLNS